MARRTALRTRCILSRPRCRRSPLEEYALTNDDAGSLAPPTAIGPYRVLHQVGAGVLGPVFRAHSADAGCEVAIKLFRLDLTPEQSRSLADALGRVCTRLPDHEHIATPRAAGLAGGSTWLACDYVPADSLDSRLRRRSALGLRHALPTLRQIASALDAADAVGIHHGSLHPRDVLVSTTGGVRVTGFGVADAIDAVGGAPLVRRPYTAPERVGPGRAPADPAADVFALGAIAVELLTGRRLVGTGAAAVGLVSGVSEGVDADVCRRALARALADSPADRFSSGRAFVEALARAVDHEAEPDVDRTLGHVAAVPAESAAEPDETGGPEPGVARQGETAAALAAESEPDRPRVAEPPPETVVPGAPSETATATPSHAAADVPAILSRADEKRPRGPAVSRRHERPAHGEAAGRPPSAEAAAASPEGERANQTPDVPLFVPGAGPPAAAATQEEPAAHEDASSEAPEPWRQRRYVPPRPSASRAVIAASLLAGLGLGLVGGYLVWGRRPAPVSTVTPRDPAAASVPSQASSPALPSDAATKPGGAVVGAKAEPIPPPATLTPPAAPVSSAPAPRAARPSRTPSTEGRAHQGGTARSTGSGPSRVEFASRPSGARVYVDGRPVGKTPLTVESLPPGRRLIRFQLDGYRPWSTTVDVASGRKVRVGASLELSAVSKGPR